MEDTEYLTNILNVGLQMIFIHVYNKVLSKLYASNLH